MEINRFDAKGHLTKEALLELIHGEPDELARLEISEHLSFCDDCLKRYTDLLTSDILLSPEEEIAPSVFAQLRKKARRVFYHKYMTVAVAACFAMALWTGGAFSVKFLDRPKTEKVYKIESKIDSIGDKINDRMDVIFDRIYNMKGVFNNGK